MDATLIAAACKGHKPLLRTGHTFAACYCDNVYLSPAAVRMFTVQEGADTGRSVCSMGNNMHAPTWHKLLFTAARNAENWYPPSFPSCLPPLLQLVDRAGAIGVNTKAFAEHTSDTASEKTGDAECDASDAVDRMKVSLQKLPQQHLLLQQKVQQLQQQVQEIGQQLQQVQQQAQAQAQMQQILQQVRLHAEAQGQQFLQQVQAQKQQFLQQVQQQPQQVQAQVEQFLQQLQQQAQEIGQQILHPVQQQAQVQQLWEQMWEQVREQLQRMLLQQVQAQAEAQAQ